MRTRILTTCLAVLALATPATAQIGIGARLGGNVGVGSNIGVGVQANTDAQANTSDNRSRHEHAARHTRRSEDRSRVRADSQTQGRVWWEGRRKHAHADARSTADFEQR